MTFAISRDELSTAFGASNVVAIPPAQLNSSVTHTDTRSFLIDVGLPVIPRFLYAPKDSLTSGLPDAASIQPRFDTAEYMPDNLLGLSRSWVVLGYCYSQRLYLDGSTGIIWELVDGTVVNSRVDLFARCLFFVYRRWEDFSDDSTIDTRESAVDALAAEIEAIDPTAMSDDRALWHQVLRGLETF